MLRRVIVFASLVPLGTFVPGRCATAAGTWSWPVPGPVIEPFDAPATPYGTGHRGIDIAAPFGTPVHAPAPGVVAFAGPVGGSLFVTVDHGGGVESTYSWLSAIAVRRGAVVAAGTPLGATGAGHAGVSPPHLHFGVRRDDVYVDPMGFLGPGTVVGLIRLAPLAAS